MYIRLKKEGWRVKVQVVESKRVNGKPRQRVIKQLASFKIIARYDKEGENIHWDKKSYSQKYYIDKYVYERLYESLAEFSEADRQILTADWKVKSEKYGIPFVTREQLNQIKCLLDIREKDKWAYDLERAAEYAKRKGDEEEASILGAYAHHIDKVIETHFDGEEFQFIFWLAYLPKVDESELLPRMSTERKAEIRRLSPSEVLALPQSDVIEIESSVVP